MLPIPKSIVMDESLQSLIKHYESEQHLLKALLDDCLLEEDYKFAKYYRNNLNALQEMLHNLYCLTDYNHAEKAEALRMLSNIKANVKRSTDNSLNGLQEQRLNELNEKLSRLNKLPQREVEEKHDLQNAIIRLLENDIKEFKLFILKKYNFYIEFSLQADEIIHMKFTPFKEFKEYFELDAFQMRTLEHIGFSVNEDMVFIDFDLKNNSINSLLILVSRIFFKVFYSHRREIFELVIY